MSSNITKYDPISYWTSETTDIPTKGQKIEEIPAHIAHCKAVAAFLEPIKNEIRTVFEIGCGYGRMTKVLLNYLPKLIGYWAIDLSDKKIEVAMKYIPLIKHYEILHLWRDNFASPMLFKRFSKSGGSYDLVFTSQVLMHQLPSEIDAWIKQMGMFSKKYIMTIDWYEDQEPDNVAPWNFIHDYDKIFDRMLQPHKIEHLPISEFKQRCYLVQKHNNPKDKFDIG